MSLQSSTPPFAQPSFLPLSNVTNPTNSHSAQLVSVVVSSVRIKTSTQRRLVATKYLHTSSGPPTMWMLTYVSGAGRIPYSTVRTSEVNFSSGAQPRRDLGTDGSTVSLNLAPGYAHGLFLRGCERAGWGGHGLPGTFPELVHKVVLM
jgi:hypothetical protein